MRPVLLWCLVFDPGMGIVVKYFLEYKATHVRTTVWPFSHHEVEEVPFKSWNPKRFRC